MAEDLLGPFRRQAVPKHALDQPVHLDALDRVDLGQAVPAQFADRAVGGDRRAEHGAQRLPDVGVLAAAQQRDGHRFAARRGHLKERFNH